jgi:tetrahydrodipicolinate N-succinyltransferase
MKEIAFISSLDPNDQNRLRVHLQTEDGALKDVMYQYETLIDDQWVAIVRYDCAHGFFHRDVLFPNGDKEKQSIEMDSLKSASKYAEQDLKDRWEWYRERYIKKMKKQ